MNQGQAADEDRNLRIEKEIAANVKATQEPKSNFRFAKRGSEGSGTGISARSSKPVDWTEKYTPKSFDEIVGNKKAIDRLKGYLERRNGSLERSWPQALLLYGPPGVGKTVSAEIFAKLSGGEVKKWNVGEEGGVDLVREEIRPFAITVSLFHSFKLVILDECDTFKKGAQNALRALMDRTIRHCWFILISNLPQDINKWVISRIFPIRYYPLLPNDVYNRLVDVAEGEKLDGIISEDQLFRIAKMCGGDLRNSIKTLQGLCEGKTKPVTDSEVESLSVEKEVATDRRRGPNIAKEIGKRVNAAKQP